MSQLDATCILKICTCVCVHVCVCVRVLYSSSAELFLHSLPTLWLELSSCIHARELVELRSFRT